MTLCLSSNTHRRDCALLYTHLQATISTTSEKTGTFHVITSMIWGSLDTPHTARLWHLGMPWQSRSLELQHFRKQQVFDWRYPEHY